MKTTFVPTRGHNYHVVHETKTAGARKSCWTLCGEYFADGEKSTHRPTCPDCVKLDNPLSLTREMIEYVRDAARLTPWRDAPRDRTFRWLLERDYVDKDAALTRRGLVLVEDLTLGAVPLADGFGVVHARRPLSAFSACMTIMSDTSPDVMLEGVDDMFLSRYAKLRKVEEDCVITCLVCLAK